MTPMIKEPDRAYLAYINNTSGMAGMDKRNNTWNTAYDLVWDAMHNDKLEACVNDDVDFYLFKEAIKVIDAFCPDYFVDYDGIWVLLENFDIPF